MNIPAPKLVRLSDDWLPWRYQVQTFGDARNYGHAEARVVITGTQNFEEDPRIIPDKERR